jgi:lysophospholipase L1-like esterase
VKLDFGTALKSRRTLLAGSGAALATKGIPGTGLAPRRVLARQATPTPDEVAYIIQFIHFEKLFAPYGVVLNEEQLAGLYSLDVETCRDVRNQFAVNARQAAEELLADPDFAVRVDQLPFSSGGTIVGVGDSITDDLQSWLEILRHLLALRRPDDQIQVINAGLSGDTTTDVLRRRYIPIILTQPTWIICMLGTNDAFRFGREPTKTAVSLDETAKNLDELRHIAATESTANWVWMTPPTCDEALFAATPYAGPLETSVSNDDVVAIADVVQRQPEPVVDLVTLFGRPPASELMLTDGIHPSLAGQRVIAQALVERLTE